MATSKKTIIQVGASSYETDLITERAIADFKEKNKAVTVKEISVYIKPEEGKVYYTVNENKYSGDFDL